MNSEVYPRRELLFALREKTVRNKIFLNTGMPALESSGYEKSPFSNSWFGKNNLGDYTYELCRLVENSQLELISTHISKDDNWIKIYLNIFQLTPCLYSIDDLQGVDGLNFPLLPNTFNRMRLRVDDYKIIPLINFLNHKLKSYYTRRGLARRAKELESLIEKNLSNIDKFVERWHELHDPLITNWNGKPS